MDAFDLLRKVSAAYRSIRSLEIDALCVDEKINGQPAASFQVPLDGASHD